MSPSDPSLPPLLIPVETQNRELDAKLVLACVAAERGFPAIVGSRIHMHRAIARMPRGIYVAKDVRRPSLRIFHILRGLGHAITACDEEGLLFITPALYHRRRVDPEALAMVELHLAWGGKSADLIRSAPGYPGFPIVETGNPRIDLLRPELNGFFAAETDALRRHYGDFVLVNTNFGRLNHFNPNLGLTPSAPGVTARRNLEPDDPPIEAWRFREAVMRAMVAMVPVLAGAFPSWRIVVRPHPSESPVLWREAGHGYTNVDVVHEGHVAPWLMAARCVVHNGCTTAIEGRLVGAPVVAYRPIVSPDHEISLPNAVGVTARDLDELVATIQHLGNGSRPLALSENEHACLEPYLAAVRGPLASDRIVDALADFAARRPLVAPALSDRLAATGDALVRAISKRINALRPGHKDSAAFTLQRFPGVDRDGVAERIARLAALTGRFDNLCVTEIVRNVFRLTRPTDARRQ